MNKKLKFLVSSITSMALLVNSLPTITLLSTAEESVNYPLKFKVSLLLSCYDVSYDLDEHGNVIVSSDKNIPASDLKCTLYKLTNDKEPEAIYSWDTSEISEEFSENPQKATEELLLEDNAKGFQLATENAYANTYLLSEIDEVCLENDNSFVAYYLKVENLDDVYDNYWVEGDKSHSGMLASFGAENQINCGFPTVIEAEYFPYKDIEPDCNLYAYCNVFVREIPESRRTIYYTGSGITRVTEPYDPTTEIPVTEGTSSYIPSDESTDISITAQDDFIVYGDINGDNKEDMLDLVELSLYLLNERDFTDIQIKSADVNGDGVINLADLAHLKQYILGVDVKLGK